MSSTSAPPSRCKLYINNISSAVDERDLFDMLSKYGKVLSCSIRSNHAFAEYSHPDDAEEAKKLLDGTLLRGRTISVQYSNDNYKSNRSGTRAPRQSENLSKTRIYVGSLPPGMTSRELEELFSECGHITHTFVVDTKGYAFVEFELAPSADLAIKQFHGYEVGGRRLVVNFATIPGTGNVRDKHYFGGSANENFDRQRSVSPFGRPRNRSASPPRKRSRYPSPDDRGDPDRRSRDIDREADRDLDRNRDRDSREGDHGRDDRNTDMTQPREQDRGRDLERERERDRSQSPFFSSSSSSSSPSSPEMGSPRKVRSRSPELSPRRDESGDRMKRERNEPEEARQQYTSTPSAPHSPISSSPFSPSKPKRESKYEKSEERPDRRVGDNSDDNVRLLMGDVSKMREAMLSGLDSIRAEISRRERVFNDTLEERDESLIRGLRTKLDDLKRGVNSLLDDAAKRSEDAAERRSEDTTARLDRRLEAFEQQMQRRLDESVSAAVDRTAGHMIQGLEELKVEVAQIKKVIFPLTVMPSDLGLVKDVVLQIDSVARTQHDTLRQDIRGIPRDSGSSGPFSKKMFPIEGLTSKVFNIEQKLESLEGNISKQIAEMKNEVLSMHAIQGMVAEDKKSGAAGPRATRKKDVNGK
eukprot:TRINITY_DN6596_c0_g1_i1.p1 TRINITY_DN6596_c0_g1~~TRINITY_DN6596_c0_g1_i1.p1  ORF type:complete len:642 (+),score=158.04 TRINITY_DN6596_c0_g1_i1:90-2015(+)